MRQVYSMSYRRKNNVALVHTLDIQKIFDSIYSSEFFYASEIFVDADADYIQKIFTFTQAQTEEFSMINRLSIHQYSLEKKTNF